MAFLPLTGHALNKEEMGYHGKFGHTLGTIQHISLMIKIEIYYTTCYLETHTTAPTLPCFHGLKCCVQYLTVHSHKSIFYPSNCYDGINFVILTCSENQFEDHTGHNC